MGWVPKEEAIKSMDVPAAVAAVGRGKDHPHCKVETKAKVARIKSLKIY